MFLGVCGAEAVPKLCVVAERILQKSRESDVSERLQLERLSCLQTPFERGRPDHSQEGSNAVGFFSVGDRVL